MFKRIRFKLTVLYAGLFCLALTFISVTAYALVRDNAERMVHEELEATGTVFDRVWQLRFQRLEDSAALSARDYGFGQAIATHDNATIASALSNIRSRLEADVVFLVTPQGAIVSERGASTAAPPPLLAALEHSDNPTGVLVAAGLPHQAVSAPVYAPNLLGWVIVAERLDADEMRALEQLASIPLQASAVVRTGDGAWTTGEGHGPSDARLGAFIDDALQQENKEPGLLNSAGGPAMAMVKPFQSLDGSSTVLLLRYSRGSALQPYQPLFGSLLAICLVSLCLVLIGGWAIAKSISQPITDMERAARKLQEGEYVPVKVNTRDEIARLADGFNAMAATIQARERKITHLALHDSDTHLPNRRSLERHVAALRQKRPIAIAAIGVDRFAEMRGAIGYTHASGLLNRLGERLSRVAPNAPMGLLSTDVLGLAFQAKDEADARQRVTRLLGNFEQPVTLDDQEVDVSVTIGVAFPSAQDREARDVIERASIALDQARQTRAKYAFFDEAAYGDPTRNLSLMGDMNRALTNGEMCLFYQPKLDMRANRVAGVEALVRWIHPRRGMISPDLFVPMAEETGHVRALTEWVIARAVEEQALLSRAGFPLIVSVNISGRLVGDREFAQSAVAAVANARHPICFEITETAVIDNPEVALENLDLFRQHNVHISIDDYGSGLSSLAYLKQLRAHELKIDKVFIQGLTNSQREALLVRSTIELAHGLGMKVTAEGVETPAAYSLLAAMGCDMAQGFFVGRPMPLNELGAMLTAGGGQAEPMRKTLPRATSAT